MGYLALFQFSLSSPDVVDAMVAYVTIPGKSMEDEVTYYKCVYT